MRWLEACQSPVWDTALAVIALADAGLAPDDPTLLRAATWLLGEEVRARGDWAVRRPDLPVGGWAFEFANDNYPDVDDTAEVVLALRRVRYPDAAALEAAIDRAISWTEGMASSDGAWGAFDADNIRDILYELPFCDFGAVIDPPSADVTAHVVEMLAAETAATAGRDRARARLASLASRSRRCLVRALGRELRLRHRRGGSGARRRRGRAERRRRFVRGDRVPRSSTRTTTAAGARTSAPTTTRRSRGVGASTASQTAWALLALDRRR